MIDIQKLTQKELECYPSGVDSAAKSETSFHMGCQDFLAKTAQAQIKRNLAMQFASQKSCQR